MAEINLLQNQEVEVQQVRTYNLLNRIGVVLLLLSIAAYATAYYFNDRVVSQVATDKAEQISLQSQIVNDKNYPALLKQQEKLSNLKILLNKHLSWGDLIQKFGQATLKTATYSKFVANAEGGATITGVVPDFQSLDKLMQGYQLNQFNYVNDVKLINVGLSDKDQSNGIQFTIKATFNKDLLQASATK